MAGYGFDLFDQGTGRRAQGDLLRPAILDYGHTLDQALRLEAVQQTGQGRAFDADALGQLALGGQVLETGQVQQDQPAGLGQVEAGQAAVQFGTPAPRHLGQLHSEAVVIGQRHRKLIIRTNY
ncbi:hypothetical protein D9M73_245700 [compost metagenome]